MKDMLADAEENAEAVLFACDCIGDIVGFEVRLVAVIVFDRRNLLVIGDVKIVVELAAERGNPRERPSLPFLVSLELAERRAGHHHEGGVAFIQQAEIADGIRVSGTARAAFLPRGIEHEVIDQELPAALE